MNKFGMPMGPFQMADLVGLDLGWRARKLAKVKPEDVPITARVADKLCELERFGQKNGRGYYIYSRAVESGNRILKWSSWWNRPLQSSAWSARRSTMTTCSSAACTR